MSEGRVGSWVETYSGTHFYPLDPVAEEIRPEDIAHSLSQICRFTGHTRFFYSVAQHCLYCAEYATKMGYCSQVQLMALLHDASEAYICDVAAPIKPHLNGYQEIEERLQWAIYERFGVPILRPDAMDDAVDEIDYKMCRIEARQLLPRDEWMGDEPDPYMEGCIVRRPISYVKKQYLCTLMELWQECGGRGA